MRLGQLVCRWRTPPLHRPAQGAVPTPHPQPVDFREISANVRATKSSDLRTVSACLSDVPFVAHERMVLGDTDPGP